MQIVSFLQRGDSWYIPLGPTTLRPDRIKLRRLLAEFGKLGERWLRVYLLLFRGRVDDAAIDCFSVFGDQGALIHFE